MVVVSHTTSGLVNAGVLRDIRCSSLHGEAYRCFRRSSLVLRNAPGRNKRIVPLVMVHGTIEEVPRLSKDIDDQLSNRHIDLDPAGYFIIKVDRERKEIVAEHYTNTINKNGTNSPWEVSACLKMFILNHENKLMTKLHSYRRKANGNPCNCVRSMEVRCGMALQHSSRP